MEIGLRQEHSLEPPTMCRGAFPRLSELLEDEKYPLSIRVVGWGKKLERYANLTDFLFVEIFIKWRSACIRFYKGKGPALKDAPGVTEEMLSKWDEELCEAAELAYECAFNRITTSWTCFRDGFLRGIE